MIIQIKNGIIVNAENSVLADVLINGTTIAHIGNDYQNNLKPDLILDASGCYIFPGAVDPHVHLHLPTAAGYSSDDFVSGSKAGLYGGTTTLIDFVTPQRGQSLVEAFLLRKEEASKSLIDYKLHVSPVEWARNTAYEIQLCYHEEYVRSFKVYMAYKKSIGLNDAAIFKVMKTVGQLGGIVTVHCEMGNEIEILRNNFALLGKVSAKYHAFSRPAHLESLAVKRAIDLAAKAECPIYIVHVSTKESVDYICKAQLSLQAVYAETCPQYLLLDDEKYKGDFDKVSKFVMSPPLRKKADIFALWQAIADGTIGTIGTDHCPFMLGQKKTGQEDFRKIPNGAGGIEHRLELLYTYGVLKNKISINRFVELVSAEPAKIFGFYPKKGIISVGSDADLVIWDPNVERRISVKTHHQNCDLNIYDGFKIRGKAKHVLNKGRLVIENDKLINESTGFYLL